MQPWESSKKMDVTMQFVSSQHKNLQSKKFVQPEWEGIMYKVVSDVQNLQGCAIA